MANEGSFNCRQIIMRKFYDDLFYVNNRIYVQEIKEICVHTGENNDQYESAN